MTLCGNFLVIGYSSGEIFKFNIQSGLEYGNFGDPKAHSGSVCSVSVNNVCRLLYSVGTNCLEKSGVTESSSHKSNPDFATKSTLIAGHFRVWDFDDDAHRLLASIELTKIPLFSRFHEDK
ncbi:unnamed protein product [Protopolystoma xenopodis]|uniref:Uncharacterized protein n=1 Tax=Protopolystoma xenopodis TaxID=117903 RepID=A0A3S5A1Y5_9PLAT|nr:unnamed protein product [Protopolystoma xenopodis]